MISNQKIIKMNENSVDEMDVLINLSFLEVNFIIQENNYSHEDHIDYIAWNNIELTKTNCYYYPTFGRDDFHVWTGRYKIEEDQKLVYTYHGGKFKEK